MIKDILLNPQYNERFFWQVAILYALALPISMSATNVVLAFLLLGAALYFIGSKSPFKLDLFLGLLCGYFFWAGCASLLAREEFSLKFFAPWQKLWNFLPLFLIPIITPTSETKEKIFILIKTVLVTGAVVACLGLIQAHFKIQYFFEGYLGAHALVDEQRFVGFQSHPLHSGALYGILFLLAFSLSLNDKIMKRKLLWVSLAFLLGAGVILTISRSYYLGVIVGSFWIALRKSWRFFSITMIAAVILLLAAMQFSPTIKKRVLAMNPQQLDQSGTQRLWIWKTGWSMFKTHPVVGIGYGNWRNYVDFYRAKFPDWKNFDTAAYAHAHNSYLTIAAESGFLGLVLFLAFWIVLFFYFFRESVHQDPNGQAAALGHASCGILLMLAVAAIFEHNFLTATVSLSASFILGASRLSIQNENFTYN